MPPEDTDLEKEAASIARQITKERGPSAAHLVAQLLTQRNPGVDIEDHARTAVALERAGIASVGPGGVLKFDMSRHAQIPSSLLTPEDFGPLDRPSMARASFLARRILETAAKPAPVTTDADEQAAIAAMPSATHAEKAARISARTKLLSSHYRRGF